MASERAVRIRRRPGAAPPGPAAAGPAGAYRPNRAGTQRAVRLTLLFLVLLAALYVLLVALDRSTPGGTTSGATSGLYLFSEIAALIGVGGAVLTLAQAPRGVEFRPQATIVVGRFGRRRPFPPEGSLSVRSLRRYPRSFLAGEPVLTLELTRENGRRATIWLEEGILAPTEPGTST
jgi:hypothetical protein